MVAERWWSTRVAAASAVVVVHSVVSEKRYVDRFFGCLAEHARPPCEANFFLCPAQYIVAIVAEQYLGKRNSIE